jgi:flagellar hook-associated protein 2
MATITSAGVGSGLDVNGLVTQLMAVEKQPLTALATKEASYQAKLSAFGTLKSAVAALQSSARALKSTTLYNSMSATSSSTSVLTASGSTAAAAGTYNLEVVKKAQAQSIASQAFTSLTSDIATADGKIKIELGTFVAATTTPVVAAASFTADAAKTRVTLEIAAGTSSISDIRDAINAANAGVKANLVYVGSEGYKLTLTSTETGAKNSVKLTVLDANDVVQTNNSELAKLSFDPVGISGSGNEFIVNTVAQDAQLKIDGLEIFRTTNSIADAITGVTMSLTTTGTSTLTVAKNTGSVKGTIDSFVKSYNDLNTQLRDLTAYNAETQQSSLLTGDAAARGLQSSMRDLVNYRRPGSISGGASSLSDLGVSLQRDGSLAFNSSKLDTAMANSNTNLTALFTTDSTSNPGLAIRMGTVLDGLVGARGIISSRTDGINSSISELGKRRTTLSNRLVQIEKRYRAQFSSLDTLVASMQKTSAFLTQQLANLPSTSG